MPASILSYILYVRRLRIFENTVLRRIRGHKMKWWEAGKDYIMRSFIT
jgi:hypothetical protein